MMTPEEMRIAIAEKCGVPLMTSGWVPTYNDPDNSSCAPCAEPAALPDYLNDLNEMHEAEKTLTPQQKWEFVLRLILDQPGSNYPHADWRQFRLSQFMAPGVFPAVFATAAQRAEAFCRVFWPERFL